MPTSISRGGKPPPQPPSATGLQILANKLNKCNVVARLFVDSDNEIVYIIIIILDIDIFH